MLQLVARSAPRLAPALRGVARQVAGGAAGLLPPHFERATRVYGPRIAAEGSSEQKLRAYALYKAATVGPCATPRPSSFDLVGTAKHAAWESVGGMSRVDAAAAYVEEFKDEFGGAGGSGGVTEVRPPPPPSSSAFLPIRPSPMLPPGTFSGRVALVTGGGTGLGRAMAGHLAALGATVVISSRKKDVLDGTARELNEALVEARAGRGPLALPTPGGTTTTTTGTVLASPPCDVRDPAAVAAVLDYTLAATGALPTLIVNNAAGNFICPFERSSSNAFASIVDIVLKGTANVTLEAGKRLIAAKQGGVFLSITTTYAPNGSAYVAASAAAKAGVHALLKSLAAEWGRKHGMRFVGIAPGPVETQGAFSRLDPSGEFKDLLTSRIPAQRLGEPGEVANLAAYLLSPYASWASGCVYTLDGGETPALGGEFNALDRVTEAQWDALEVLGRKANKK